MISSICQIENEVLNREERLLYDFYAKELNSRDERTQKHYISHFENQLQKAIQSCFVKIDFSKLKVIKMIVKDFKEKTI